MHQCASSPRAYVTADRCVVCFTCSVCVQEEREGLMQQMQELQAQVEAQQTELQQYAENDPETLAKVTEATEVCMCV